jgi:ABC-type enterobactin transport system permease subunit
MCPAIVPFAVAAFLSGTVTAVFVMLVAGIHATDRHRPLTTAPGGHIDAFTRYLLGVGVRTSRPAGSSDSGKN